MTTSIKFLAEMFEKAQYNKRTDVWEILITHEMFEAMTGTTRPKDDDR